MRRQHTLICNHSTPANSHHSQWMLSHQSPNYNSGMKAELFDLILETELGSAPNREDHCTSELIANAIRRSTRAWREISYQPLLDESLQPTQCDIQLTHWAEKTSPLGSDQPDQPREEGTAIEANLGGLEAQLIPPKLEERHEPEQEVRPEVRSQSTSGLSRSLKTGSDRMRGILQKQAPGVIGTWSDRYCSLGENCFIYKETEIPMSPIAGVLNFDLLSCSIEHAEDYLKLAVLGSEKEFVFRGEKLDRWAKGIRARIEKYATHFKYVSIITCYPRFWRKEYIECQKFEALAETGDLLLFRGNKNSSKIQRVLTQGEYDHIGVILLNLRGDALLLESNGSLGVGLMPWKKFAKQKWHKYQQLITFRKLRVRRTEEFLREAQSFAEENLGKAYSFSLADYLFRRSSQVESEVSSYCCSSLVAKMYKVLGLIDQERSCCSYLPSSFADRNVEIVGTGKHGFAELEAEQVIAFKD